MDNQRTMMTIDEAIEHCRKKSCGNSECSKEHNKQLAEWLCELKALREQSESFVDKACECLEEIIFDRVDTLAYDKDGVEFVASMDGKEFADFFRKVMEA